MPTDLTFTGERFLPTCSGEIAYEHWHRYAFARHFVAGRRVLDAACGEGYGTAYLSDIAAAVVGLDLDGATIVHASARYASCPRARFVQSSCTTLPFADACFDVVVSFETVEHLEAADQVRMLAEFARVLTPSGLLVISSPNKRLYSDARGYVNEFHRHELYRDGFADLLAAHFLAQQWHHQRLACWSGIWTEGEASGVEAWIGDGEHVMPYAHPEGIYFIVVAARSRGTVLISARVSLFTDTADSELKRSETNAAEALRLDRLLGEHDAVLEQQTGHIRHLETLLAEHQRVIGQRDAELAAMNTAFAEVNQALASTSAALNSTSEALAARAAEVAERDGQLAERARSIDSLQTRVDELESALKALHERLAAREQVILYRESWRWWVRIPFLPIKRWIDARTARR